MKLNPFIVIGCLFAVGLFPEAKGQVINGTNLTTIVSNLSETTPVSADALPAAATYYSAQNAAIPPLPFNLNGLPAWGIDTNAGLYLLDDLDFDYFGSSGSHTMARESFAPEDAFNQYTPAFDTNGLWLEMVTTSNAMAYLKLHNATNQVYAIWSTTNLNGGSWDIETEVWPTNSTVMPFTVPTYGRDSFFALAQDWTTTTEGSNTVPDWWLWKYFGTTSLSDTNHDSQGNTLLSDYQNHQDPNVISFLSVVTNNYINAFGAPVQLNVSAGTPFFYAIAVDDTNYLTDAVWQPFVGTNLTALLGVTEGWHEVWIGLRGKPADATATWQRKRLKLDLTAPAIVVTNPTVSTLNTPLLRVQGYCAEELSSLTYDLTNAAGIQTNLDAGITDQFYSTNTFEFTTNYFDCVDIKLTNGVNGITFHAKDRAGNITTTNFSFTFDPSTRTNSPVINLYWPQTNTLVCNSNYTWRGWVDDPSSTVVCQQVDASGLTNVFEGIVERDGKFWVEDLPMTGTNYLTLTVTDSAGNIATTNITISPGTVHLTIDPPASSVLWNKFINVTGTMTNSNYTVWVNGVKAVLHDDHTWAATNVYLPEGGTALIQARAIPNSNNGGNGTGGSGGGPVTHDNLGNPDPPQDEDAEVQVDKPTQIIEVADYYNNSLKMDDGSYATSDVVDWKIDAPYHIYLQESAFYPGYFGIDTSDQACPPLPESIYNGDDPDGVQTYVNNINGTVTTGTTPGIEPWYPASEHSDITEEWEGGTYRFNSQSKYTLKTGGKAKSGRKNLFQLSASAAQLLYIVEPSNIPIPPQNLTVAGQPLGSDGNLYVVLADNVTKDVTPKADGISYYTFNVSQQKYKLTIVVNDIQPLSEDRVRNGAQYCVGQYLSFSPSWSPALPAGTTASPVQWTLEGDFVNESSQATTSGPSGALIPVGSINYDKNSSLLQNESTSAWWTSGGSPAKKYEAEIGETLNFVNGQTAVMLGKGFFTMYKPEVRPKTGTTQLGSLWYSDPRNTILDDSGSYMAVELEDSPMIYMVEIYSTFRGNADEVQLISGSTGSDVIPTITAGPNAADNSVPYNGIIGVSPNTWTLPPVIFQDGPTSVGGITSAFISYSFKDYIRFTPDGIGSIPVSLARVDWSYGANASRSFGATVYYGNCPPPTFQLDDSFPYYTYIYSNP